MVALDYWHSWWLERDLALVFESERLDDALAVWNRHAAPIPARTALTARVLKPFLPFIWIAERTAPGDYRFRLMGSHVALVIGDMQGHPLSDCFRSAVLKHWVTALDIVLDELAPCRFVSYVAFHDRAYARAELLKAPLLDAEGRPTMLLGVVNFRHGPGADERVSPSLPLSAR